MSQILEILSTNLLSGNFYNHSEHFLIYVQHMVFLIDCFFNTKLEIWGKPNVSLPGTLPTNHCC